jgi:hypothetical protein
MGWTTAVLRSAAADGATVDLHRPNGVQLIPPVVGVVYPSAREAEMIADRRRWEMPAVPRHKLNHERPMLR